jgi:hypothetical protein
MSYIRFAGSCELSFSLSIHACNNQRSTSALQASSYNRLKLPGIAKRVLNDRPARAHHIPLSSVCLGLLLGEVDAAVLRHPAARLCELNDSAFGVEKEQVLCVGDREGRVGALGARGDFGADGVDQDLLYRISIPLS